MKAEELKSCMTCRFLMQKCRGNCEECNRKIVRGINDTGCKCLECYDENTDIYKYYEADAELLSLIEEDNDEDE